MPDGTIKVHHGEITNLDVHGEDGSWTDDHALAELHARTDQRLRVYEGQEFRSSGGEWGDELLLHRRQTNASEVDGIGRWLMAGKRKHRRKAAEGG